jgi:hypothetical protein
MFSRATIPAAFLFLATLSACSTKGSDTPPPPVPRPTERAVRFQDCAELQQYLLDAATQQGQLETLHGGLAPAPGADAAVEAGGTGNSREYTGTNVQESGIDETDFVKTDGDYIYLLTGGQFLIFDAWPPAATTELSRTTVDGAPVGLFVRGDVAAVLTQSWQYEVATGFIPRSLALVDVSLFDLTDRSTPVLLRKMSLEGSFNAGRLVGDRMHLVLQTLLDLSVPTPLPMPAEGGAGPAPVAQVAGDDAGVAALIPGYADTLFSGTGPDTVIGTLCACEDFYRPAVPNGTGIVTLVSLDLADPTAALHSVALASNSGVVYGSGDSIYLATRNDDYWFWWSMQADAEPKEPEATTVVHRFSLDAEPTYQASGEVPGWVLNAYSMSEYQGTLRIATTDDSWWQGREPANGVYLLQQVGDQLQQVGALTGLGKPGESIYAVRFLGPRGYVVTFLQVDPLYALDLSDPTQPAVDGELEVPGVSTYLHPVGDTHLIAVGQHTNPWGVDLSLFDVRDPSAPNLVDREFLGEGSHSEAQYEPKAFTYFDAAGVLAIPAVSWNALPTDAAFDDGGVFAGAYVYDVDLESGFTRRGAVDHTQFYEDSQAGLWYYPEPIRRSFFIRDAGEGPYLYTVSRRGLKVTGMDDLTQDIAAHELPAEEIYWLDVLMVE